MVATIPWLVYADSEFDRARCCNFTVSRLSGLDDRRGIGRAVDRHEEEESWEALALRYCCLR